MDKEQKKLLVAAWEMHHRILRDIESLASMNISLAYGLIRTAETMIDFKMVENIMKPEKKEEK